MPALSSSFAPSATAPAASFSAALKASRTAKPEVQSPWLRLAVVVALLAIAVQLVVMAQLAQHQVQRGVQLRQAIAAERADASFAATSTATSTDIASEQDAALSVQTASSYPQDRHQRLLVVQASH
ncbi:MAG: hypothetical protein KAY08_01055 [Giesbergeria sp.]|nr:hypothetical protein [Giesbergeria sp.]